MCLWCLINLVSTIPISCFFNWIIIQSVKDKKKDDLRIKKSLCIKLTSIITLLIWPIFNDLRMNWSGISWWRIGYLHEFRVMITLRLRSILLLRTTIVMDYIENRFLDVHPSQSLNNYIKKRPFWLTTISPIVIIFLFFLEITLLPVWRYWSPSFSQGLWIHSILQLEIFKFGNFDLMFLN